MTLTWYKLVLLITFKKRELFLSTTSHTLTMEECWRCPPYSHGENIHMKVTLIHLKSMLSSNLIISNNKVTISLNLSLGSARYFRESQWSRLYSSPVGKCIGIWTQLAGGGNWIFFLNLVPENYLPLLFHRVSIRSFDLSHRGSRYAHIKSPSASLFLRQKPIISIMRISQWIGLMRTCPDLIRQCYFELVDWMTPFHDSNDVVLSTPSLNIAMIIFSFSTIEKMLRSTGCKCTLTNQCWGKIPH